MCIVSNMSASSSPASPPPSYLESQFSDMTIDDAPPTYLESQLSIITIDDNDDNDNDDASLPCYLDGIPEQPHWKPAERQAILSTIMAAEPQLADRELRGVINSSSNRIFDKSWVMQFFNRPHYTFEHKPSIVWIGIDPSGGGTQSDFAIASMTYENQKHVVSFTTYNMAYTPRIILTNTPNFLNLELVPSGYFLPLAPRPCIKKHNPDITT